MFVVSGDGDSTEVQNTVSWDLDPDATGYTVCRDGTRFIVVGSNDAVLTSADGLARATYIPGTSDINFVAVTQWDSGLPAVPVVGVVGSGGTFVVGPENDPGIVIRTGTTQQFGGITCVDDGEGSGYFVIVGNDGTVMTARQD